MKKKERGATPARKIKNSLRWNEIFLTGLAVVMLAGIVLWFGISVYQQERADRLALEKYKANLPAGGVKLDHKRVCMSSNVYMGEEQLEVQVHGKPYYACSSQCKMEILNNEKMQFAVDPFSGKSVDKSQAFISMDPGRLKKILYFESEENVERYLKK